MLITCYIDGGRRMGNELPISRTDPFTFTVYVYGAGKIGRLTTRPNTWTTSRKEVPFSPLSTWNKNHKTYGRERSEDYFPSLLCSYFERAVLALPYSKD